ncbi:MAG: PQQ-dependent sugar dehydrogenase, partial [Nannocystaceae bacterium]
DPQLPPCPYAAVSGDPELSFELVGEGFDRPVLALGDPAAPDRLFVVEQGGHIKVLEAGETQAPSDADAFLVVDVQNANSTQVGPEMGLLGFAFHPDYPEDPRVYVNYNPASSSSTVISEFTVSARTGKAEDERVIMEVCQPASNHNGGMIAFGPDRMLYIGMGDGGGADDVFMTGQTPEVVLGKMLRIDPEPTGTADKMPVGLTNSTCQGYGRISLPRFMPWV